MRLYGTIGLYRTKMCYSVSERVSEWPTEWPMDQDHERLLPLKSCQFIWWIDIAVFRDENLSRTRPVSPSHFRRSTLHIQEPLLDWKVVCYQMAIAKSEGDLWIIFHIGRLSEIRLSSSPQGLISSDSRWASFYTQIWFQTDFLSDRYPEMRLASIYA